jgi:hypothetical protein
MSVTATQLLALRLTRDLLLGLREARERDAKRRQDRLGDLEPGGDTYKQEEYEIAFAKGEANGLQVGMNHLGELMEAFRQEATVGPAAGGADA